MPVFFRRMETVPTHIGGQWWKNSLAMGTTKKKHLACPVSHSHHRSLPAPRARARCHRGHRCFHMDKDRVRVGYRYMSPSPRNVPSLGIAVLAPLHAGEMCGMGTLAGKAALPRGSDNRNCWSHPVCDHETIMVVGSVQRNLTSANNYSKNGYVFLRGDMHMCMNINPPGSIKHMPT